MKGLRKTMSNIDISYDINTFSMPIQVDSSIHAKLGGIMVAMKSKSKGKNKRKFTK